MSDKIEIDRAEKGADKPVPKKAVWQCRHRNYREILPYVDDKAAPTASGGKTKVVVQARNWRIELDLEDKDQRRIHEYLVKRQAINNEYQLLTDKTKGDKISEEGQTLQKLVAMSMPQLMQCITDEDLTLAGLVPGQTDRFQLIALIMKKKKLV